MNHLRGVVLAVGGLIAILPGASGTADRTTHDLLERYNRGEYEAVAADLVASGDPLSIRHDLEQSASAWAEMPGMGDVGRRRLVVATFALEVARAQLEIEWRAVRSLIETGCEIVRRSPPGPTEHVWQLALAEGGMDAPLLLDGGHHWSHASSRFPTEPRFRLAKIVLDEVFIDREARGEDAYPIALATRARQSLVASAYKTLFDRPGCISEATGADRPISSRT